jgi:hypothetical protein
MIDRDDLDSILLDDRLPESIEEQIATEFHRIAEVYQAIADRFSRLAEITKPAKKGSGKR